MKQASLFWRPWYCNSYVAIGVKAYVCILFHVGYLFWGISSWALFLVGCVKSSEQGTCEVCARQTLPQTEIYVVKEDP